MNMKKYLPIILLLIALILPSCAGIGDGALFDNITAGDKTDADADPAWCQIYPGMSPEGTVRTKSAEAMELLTTLDNGEYRTDIDRTAEEKPYFELTYDSLEMHFIVYGDDFVVEKTENIDFAMNNDVQYTSLGKLDGIYDQTEQLYVSTLNAVTDEERAAGYKLNCLQVEMKPEISRIFYLSDFEDIGGFYMIYVANQPSISSSFSASNRVIVYFKSCTPEELEAKIDKIKQNAVVESVEKVLVGSTY